MRKEQFEGVTLYLGDSLEIMGSLDTHNHIICDPPYEQISQDRIGGIKRNDGGTVTEKLDFQGIDLIRGEVCRSAKRLSQGWVLMFSTAEGVAPWRDEIESAGIKYKSPMIWVKPDAMPKMNGQGPAIGYENIVSSWAGSGPSCWNSGGKRGVYTYNVNSPNRVHKDDGGHPTEKPLPLMMELVNDFTNHGQTVLDPFMGSGTTGVACVKLGRRFTGIEINEKYFDLACRRIEKALSMPDLFIPPVKAVQEKMF